MGKNLTNQLARFCVLAFLGCLSLQQATAQGFGGCAITSNDPAAIVQSTPVAIPDDPTVTSTLNVAGLDTRILDLNVQIFLTHTFAADLDITLTAPSGRVVTLTTDNGAGNDNVFNGTIFDDQSNNTTTNFRGEE